MKNTRKSNGEGSVFQVSENKWVAKISLGTGENGETIIKQFSGKTEAIVKKKLREYKKSEEFAVGHKPSSETVQTYFTRWLQTYQYNKLKPASYDRLETTVNRHILPCMGHKRIEKVTRDDIQGLINKMYYQDNLSYSTVKKVYVALNACYKHAQVDDVVLKNPCLGIVLPSQAERTKQVVAFSDDELKRLITELSRKDEYGNDVYFYAPAFVLILHTGMRMGEALSLTWEDVNFSTKTISIQKNSILIKNRNSNGEISGGYSLHIQNSTKTASGERIVPMNRTAEEALNKLHQRSNGEYVIENQKGNPVLPSNFERSFQTVLRNCGIDEHGVHTLRHTFASRLFNMGVDGKVISKLLGHASVKITYDIYVHLMPKDVEYVTMVLDE